MCYPFLSCSRVPVGAFLGVLTIGEACGDMPCWTVATFSRSFSSFFTHLWFFKGRLYDFESIGGNWGPVTVFVIY